MSNKKTGSYVYILNKKTKASKILHRETLNKAKFEGLSYFYEEDEPFYRFTKIPFPHLFYVSPSYIVYVEYARLKDKSIPYTIELTDFDKDVTEDIELFQEVFGKDFVYDRDARSKTKDRPKREQRKGVREKKGKQERMSYYKKYGI